VRRRVLWSFMIGLAAALVLLIVRHDEGTINGLDEDFGSLIYKIVLLVAVGSLVLALFRHRFSEALTAALLWVVIALALVLAYTYRSEVREVGEHVLAELIPGRPISHGRTV
jgi:aspartyl protease family protein